MLQSSMDQCEESLDNAQGMQQYTLRGVKLLVRCVANMIQDTSGDTSAELARYIQENEENLALLQDHPSTPQYRSRNNNHQQDIPIASAITPATTTKNRRLFTTPTDATITAPAVKSTSFLRKSSSSSASSDPVEESDSAFSDIRALLGH